MNTLTSNPARRFARDTQGGMSVEAIIIIPMLFWALVATLVFFDGFRTRTQTQVAAQTVADLLSRETHMFTASYLEGMNDVFDFIADSRFPTRMRVSSIIWNSADEINRLQWSYGTRNLAPLPEETFELLAAGEYATLQALFETNGEDTFTGSAAQAPRPDLADRIPPVLPGEALILVESMALWSPFFNVGITPMRFDPIVVTRPRFTPWVHLEGAIPIFPEDDYEVAIAGYNPLIPDPEEDNEPEPEPEPIPVTVNQNFENGVTSGWSQNTLTTTQRPGTGTFLGPFGQETWSSPLRYSVNLGAQPVETARIEFDLLILDSWDAYDPSYSLAEGDAFSILVDGTPITFDIFAQDLNGFTRNNRSAIVNMDGSVYSTELRLIQQGTNFFGGSWTDQIWRVTIDIEAPPPSFQLGFSARLSNNIANEAFGIDNFSIDAIQGTPVSAGFIVDPSNQNGTDPHTRFRRYTTCPDPRIAANWLTLRNSDLTQPLTFRRRAGGSRNINSCNLGVGSRFISANPHFAVHYINDTSNINGNRVRIRIDDSNSGRTCDTTLLILNPNGQWWFNHDLPNNGRNAGLNMGHALPGTFYVWIGQQSNGYCNSDVRVIFERY